jgi:hypothetical protein
MLARPTRETVIAMASVDEIVTALQSASERISDAVGSLNAAEQDAGEMEGQFAAMGVQDKAAEFAAVRETIERARVQLRGGADVVSEAANQAKTAAG